MEAQIEIMGEKLRTVLTSQRVDIVLQTISKMDAFPDAPAIGIKSRKDGVALCTKKGNFILFEYTGRIRVYLNPDSINKYEIQMSEDGNGFYYIKKTDVDQLENNLLITFIQNSFRFRHRNIRKL